MKNVIAFLVPVLALLAGCDAIVGGRCRPGTVVCDGRCVDVSSDELSCGGCGLACATTEHCDEGVCVVGTDDAGVPSDAPGTDVLVVDGGAPDAGVPDAGVWDAGSVDGSVTPLDGAFPDGSFPDGSFPDGSSAPVDGSVIGADGGLLVCDLGELACEGRCVDLGSDPTSCGGCGIECATGDLCEAGHCVSICGPGTTRCGGACVDTTDDPDHCGGCGVRCDSGVCEAGVCVGSVAGHLVVVGHDYETARPGMDRLLGNAVLLAPGSTVRVLAWQGAATAASIAGTERATRTIATAMSRPLVWTEVDDGELVPLELDSADVFLVHAQAGAVDETLGALGVLWSRALVSFLHRGGVVVVLETMAAHRGTWTVLEPAGLADIDHLEEATGSLVRLVAPADALAVGVPVSYRGERLSVRLVGASLPIVAADDLGAVVLHDTVTTP